MATLKPPLGCSCMTAFARCAKTSGPGLAPPTRNRRPWRHHESISAVNTWKASSSDTATYTLAAAASPAVALTAAVVASCFVGRKSSEYKCDDDADCEPNRKCVRSYCVVELTAAVDANPCPAACNNGCNLTNKTCNIACDTPNRCTGTTCPAGYACTIACSANSST